MSKHNPFVVLFVLLPAIAFAQKVVVVADFTTPDAAIEDKMPGVADVLRNELAKNNLIRLVDRSHFEQTFNELAQQRMGFTDPSSVKKIGAMFNADYLIYGAVTRQGNTDSNDVFGPGITATVSAQMVDVQTGRILGSGIISPASWNDYLNKAPAWGRAFIDKIPQTAAFAGKWEASIEHEGYEDFYEITFLPDNKCSVTVASYDPDNQELTQTAEGTYAWNSSILSINVNFRRVNTVRHLTKIEWKGAIDLNNAGNSFTIVVPSTTQANAKRVRATFNKK
jgi:hypothetical protein